VANPVLSGEFTPGKPGNAFCVSALAGVAADVLGAVLVNYERQWNVGLLGEVAGGARYADNRRHGRSLGLSAFASGERPSRLTL